jgi:hypothetical protein
VDEAAWVEVEAEALAGGGLRRRDRDVRRPDRRRDPALPGVERELRVVDAEPKRWSNVANRLRLTSTGRANTLRLMAAAFTTDDLADLPGFDLVMDGIRDLEHRRETRASLLVALAAARLRRAGLQVSETGSTDAKDRLWALIEAESGDDAHRIYNALLGRVLSFAAALEALETSRRRSVRAPGR